MYNFFSQHHIDNIFSKFWSRYILNRRSSLVKKVATGYLSSEEKTKNEEKLKRKINYSCVA